MDYKKGFNQLAVCLLIASVIGTNTEAGKIIKRDSAKEAGEPPVQEKQLQEEKSQKEKEQRRKEVVPVEYASIQDMLNHAELNTQNPKSKVLQSCVKQVLEKVTTDDMDSDTKLRACYDFVVEYMRTNKNPGIKYPMDNNIFLYSNELFPPEEGWGRIAFQNFNGSCVHYNSMFILLARAIGFDCEIVRGTTPAAGTGEYTEHKWVELYTNGQVYIFDPYLESQFAGIGTKGHYQFYCTTYEKESRRFHREEICHWEKEVVNGVTHYYHL